MRHPPPRRFARHHARAGFSLIEIIIAVIVFTLGVLGVGGTSVVAARLTSNARRRSVAVMAAAGRLDRLRAGGCVSSGGTSVAGSIHEHWVASLAGGVLALSDSVHDDSRAGRDLGFTSAASC